MESSNTSLLLKYTSPAWPTQLASVTIFVGVMSIFLFAENVPVLIPAISFGFMLLVVFVSADTTVIADKSSRSLTVIKKRILGSTNTAYVFDDIAFLCQNITTSTNQKGESYEKTTYTLGLNSQTGTFQGYYRGRKPISLPIPTSIFTILNKTLRSVQEFTRARELAKFIGVPLFVNGGSNDTLVNTAEVIPGYLEGIQHIPEALAQGNKESEKAAREILGDKYPS